MSKIIKIFKKCRNILNKRKRMFCTRSEGILLERSNNYENIQLPENEPAYGYFKDSIERKKLLEALNEISSTNEDIPIMIGDKKIRTGPKKIQSMPHDFCKVIATYYYANVETINEAITTAVKAQREWDNVPMLERFEIWERAVELMRTKYRYHLNAATMLGQAKTVVQAEIDAAAELIDFFTFNMYSLKQALNYQPLSPNPNESVNTWFYRGLEGFVAAITPFNFTAIAGNLAYTPPLIGNAVIWKPSDTSILSNYLVYKIFREAGVPGGVVNFVPCDGPTFGKTVTKSQHLAALNFTGSSATFSYLWKEIGNNLTNYINFPRLVGECGGKNYHLVCNDADLTSVVNGTIRSAFEYSGQKCSACSRLYVSRNMWHKLKPALLEARRSLVIGSPTEFNVFTSAVIDKRAFMRIKSYLDYAKSQTHSKIIGGGTTNNSRGYFIDPTIIEVKDPNDKLMTDEIFGPVLCVYVYPENDLNSVVNIIKSTSFYALTGSVFTKDFELMKVLLQKLKYTAGNLYINDKSTGSVVGQQPFGGARLSGTNDKAGGPHYILRFSSPQVIKQNFLPITTIKYPYMID